MSCFYLKKTNSMAKSKSVPLNQPKLPSFFEYIFLLSTIWKTKVLTNRGNYHNLLSENIKKFLNNENLILYANGHLALEAAIQVLESKGEIITTPFTFVSTTQAIIRSGCIPIFCDIDPINFVIDASKVESLITEKTVAILPVYVYGNIPDLEKLQDISTRYNIPLIYDAAHAFGSKYQGRSISDYGDFVMFSFHATKPFHSVEGGALVFRDIKYKNKLNAIQNFGIDSLGDNEIINNGGNAKLSEFNSIMGLLNLKRFSKDINNRSIIWSSYVNGLSQVSQIKVPISNPFLTYNYSYFVIIINDGWETREKLIEFLETNFIKTRKYFSPLTSEIPSVSDHRDELYNANYLVNRVLSLPIFTDMTLHQCNLVTSKIREFFNQ